MTDRHGVTLQIGDHVSLEAQVTAILPGEDHVRLQLQVQPDLPPAPPVYVNCYAGQVLKVLKVLP